MGLGNRADDRQEIVTQEHPHFPEQMFRGTGSPWIPNEYIAPALHRAQQNIGKTGEYIPGLLGGKRAGKNARADQEHMLLTKQPYGIEHSLGAACILQRPLQRCLQIQLDRKSVV